MIKNVDWSYVKYRLLLSEFNETWIFSRQIFWKKYSNIKNFSTKICNVGAKFFHSDARTDRHDDSNCRYSKICKST